MPNAIEMIGKQFGKLTVISEWPERKHGQKTWVCRCECGNVTRPILGYSLRCGDTKSCGCISVEAASKLNFVHGKGHTRIYNIWHCMVHRCHNPINKRFPSYGGRGIGVCEEWRDNFQAFHDWAMVNGYREDLTIDRIDNDGDYSPKNCRWITMAEQQNNKSTSRMITIGTETRTLAQWSRAAGVSPATISKRMTKGESGLDLIRPARKKVMEGMKKNV